MFGATNAMDNRCPKFGGSGEMLFNLPASSSVATIFVQGQYSDSNWSIDLIQVEVLDTSGQW